MLQLLNNITHKDLRVITRRGAPWGDNVMSAPATPDEFRSLQAHYPILFAPDGQGSFLPVVGGDADYIPLSMQRMPFSIGVADEELRMMVDMASPRISHGAEGEAVFLPHGGTSDFAEHANSVLHTLHQGLQAAPEFIQALQTHGLLESFVLNVDRPDGTRGQLGGFYLINEERLAALDAATVGLLHQADYLQPIYMAIASLSNLPKLIRLHLAREA
jgi:hypothetical protein